MLLEELGDFPIRSQYILLTARQVPSLPSEPVCESNFPDLSQRNVSELPLVSLGSCPLPCEESQVSFTGVTTARVEGCATLITAGA